MIQDLDETLKTLLIKQLGVDVSTIDISFDMPGKEWESGLNRPTINLFLYDIRENHELRSRERYLSRNGSTGTIERSPVRVDFTYLVTVWTNNVSDEHEILGQLLAGLIAIPSLPKDVLQGVLSQQKRPVAAWIAQPDRTPTVWDFWSALDGRLKAGFSYAVTLAIETVPPEPVGLVTLSKIRLKMKAKGA